MKNLIRNAIRSFKTNKISLIGLIFLLFFGLGAFVTMSNTTANIKNEYNSISAAGKLHDFTASELYEVGSAGYLPNTRGLSFTSDGSAISNFTAYTVQDFIKIDGISTNAIYHKTVTDTTIPAASQKPYYISIPEQQYHEATIEGVINRTYVRTYHITLDQSLSTGLFSFFAKEKKGTTYTSFTFRTSHTYIDGEEEVPTAVTDLQTLLDTWKSQTPSAEQIEACVRSNIFSLDYNSFMSFVNEQTQRVYSVMTTTDTPLAMYIKDNFPDEVDYRYFKSLNVTATKDNIFYKIINSNREDEIDKLVLFKDPVGRYGNQLFSINDWAPYNSEIVIYTLEGEVYEPGYDFEDFTIPKDFTDVATTRLYTLDEIRENWTEDKKFAYSQIIQIRFKRMLAGKRTTNALDELLNTLAAKNKTREWYYEAFYNDQDLMDAYQEYIDSWVNNWAESITISGNGSVVFSWVRLATPQTCTLTNWTSRFSVVNPQHLSANNKKVIDPSLLNNFAPYKYWYKLTYGHDCGGEIDANAAKAWFNTLTFDQFLFWIKPDVDKMVYDNFPNGSSVIVTKNDWHGIDKEYIAPCGGYEQIIWGCGITPDFMFPVVDISRPTPNSKTECLVYCNDSGYKTIKLAFINSTVEEYLLARFKPNVNTNRRQEIVNDINTWAKTKMIWPDNVQCAYFANDTSNVLNCAGFRIAYIPNLVRTIDIVSIILCSFIGILAFIICFVIIKRYVERNRINIGIMRANGISKWKIALSLFPFALFPAIIGGMGAYFAGLFLQAPTLMLFRNYWTLPTALIGFNWLTLLVCILGPFLLFGLITFIATMVVLRTKAVELMKAGSEFKANAFSRVVKKPFKYFGVLTRFRVALAFNSLSRLVMMALMSCLTMSSLVFAFTTFDKLNQSRAINSSQFNYSFNLKLTTPTASGSVYETYDFSSLGQVIPEEYLFNINWNTGDNSYPGYSELMYPELTRWYSHDFLSTDTDTLDILKNNANLMMPSAADMNGQNLDLMYLADKVSSKFTLDYNLGASIIGISSNPWEIALSLMPANSRNLANDAFNKNIQTIGENVAKATKAFEAALEEQGIIKDPEAAQKTAGKWCRYTGLGTLLSPYRNELADFFSVDTSTGEPVYKLNVHSWLTGFSNAFNYLIVTAYQDQDIIRSEYPIAYRQIPLNWDIGKSSTIKRDELYTYVEASIGKLSTNAKVDQTHTINIEGIPADSNFVYLTDKNGQEINSLLFSENYLQSQGINESVHPLIVNAFAAHKYNLNVGSTITVTAHNMVDRYERKIHPDKFKEGSDRATFKVVGISVGTNDEAFYTSQSIANRIIGLPDGKSWNKTHRYMMWQSEDDYRDKSKIPELVDLAGLGADQNHVTKYTFIGDDEYKEPIVDKTSVQKKEYFKVHVPMGFNGIYTANKTGKPLTNGMSLYSYTGMYPGTSVYKTKGTVNKFAEILMNRGNLGIANLMSCINDEKYYKACNEYSKLTDPTEKQKTDYRNIVDEFIEILAGIYGDTTMVTAICGAMDVAASDLIYTNLINTFNLAETSIMAIIILITIIIVGIISNLIIIDSKKMAAMLKALGYSDRKNLMSILAMFIPTIIFGLALAIPLSFGLLYGYQALIFTSANILVDITQKWWFYVAAIGGIGVILMGAYAIGYRSLKKDRLVDQIK